LSKPVVPVRVEPGETEKLVSRPLRLLGLGVSNLREPNGQQLVLL
jgi:hypothetical protein